MLLWLQENLFLRDVFGLGSPLGKDAEKELYTKEERVRLLLVLVVLVSESVTNSCCVMFFFVSMSLLFR